MTIKSVVKIRIIIKLIIRKRSAQEQQTLALVTL